uniref:Uncharacterized protein n=1 Tax=Grammatophora oceanica TaxID=210454 RepID=A0A7S1V0I9_9STRA|mmetsp:Transcript_29863/g.44094  ORF Transcript_29863/g.44094 Transcript_29863/m.44094 type:complete len:119 (+) Transcript_29863:1167-1523(+)
MHCTEHLCYHTMQLRSHLRMLSVFRNQGRWEAEQQRAARASRCCQDTVSFIFKRSRLISFVLEEEAIPRDQRFPGPRVTRDDDADESKNTAKRARCLGVFSQSILLASPTTHLSFLSG